MVFSKPQALYTLNHIIGVSGLALDDMFKADASLTEKPSAKPKGRSIHPHRQVLKHTSTLMDVAS